MITIACSSIHFGEAREIASRLNAVGVATFLPTMAVGFDKVASAAAWEPLVTRFFDCIGKSNILYVFAPQGTVGIAVASSIGYARGRLVRVVSSTSLADGAVACLVGDVWSPDELVANLTCDECKGRGVVWDGDSEMPGKAPCPACGGGER